MEDSTGVRTLLALRLSRWEAARTQQLLTMVQVRPVLTPFSSTLAPFVVILRMCTNKAPNSWTGGTRRGICVAIEEATGRTTTRVNRFGVARMY